MFHWLVTTKPLVCLKPVAERLKEVLEKSNATIMRGMCPYLIGSNEVRRSLVLLRCRIFSKSGAHVGLLWEGFEFLGVFVCSCFHGMRKSSLFGSS